MRREFLLAGAIGVVALTLGVGATAVPGVISDTPENVRPSTLSVQQPYWPVASACRRCCDG